MSLFAHRAGFSRDVMNCRDSGEVALLLQPAHSPVSVGLQSDSGDALTVSRDLAALPLVSGDWIELEADPAALQHLLT